MASTLSYGLVMTNDEREAVTEYPEHVGMTRAEAYYDAIITTLRMQRDNAVEMLRVELPKNGEANR